MYNKLIIAIMGMFAGQIIGIIATVINDLYMLQLAAAAGIISAITVFLPKDL